MRASVFKNSLYNLLGQGLPLLLAIFTIPPMIARFGPERFGVLMLALMVIGYFSLFDFGLSRALTMQVSARIGEGREAEVPEVALTALFMMMVLGAIGALVLVLLSGWIVQSALKIPSYLHEETLAAFYLLSFSVVVVIVTAGLRGILEAYHMFGSSNMVRIIMGVFTFASPLLVSFFTLSLFAVVAVLLFGRILIFFIYLSICLRRVPAMRSGRLNMDSAGALLRFGGWMTVTNIVGPLMVYLDRFLIGAVISMASVTYYTTPYEVVTKLLMIPAAIAGALFPAFANGFAQGRDAVSSYFGSGVKYTLLSIFPFTLLLVVLSREALDLWIGPEFAEQSAQVLQWLAMGVFLNGFAQVPFALIQGCGRPDITAKLHLVELPFYLAAIWFLTMEYGIVGAALAWALRAAVDAIALFALSLRFVGVEARVGRMASMALIGIAVVFAGSFLNDLVFKAVFLAVTLAGFFVLAWSYVLNCSEKEMIVSRLDVAAIFNRKA